MKSLLILVFLLIASIVQAQSFPYTFMGHWKGELLWYQQGKKAPQRQAMQLIIQPTDTANNFTWQLRYGNKNEDTRPYLLKPIDTAKGHWVIDEQNGILLDQYLIGPKLCGGFTVSGTTLTNCYWIERNKLVIEFLSLSAKDKTTSGGRGRDIPYVDSYPVKAYQKAILTKVKKGQPVPLPKPKS